MYSVFYKRYVTVLLLVIYILNQTDRAIFGFLMQPIKQALGLSDAQLGFLAGPAVAVLYAILGVPIARFADRSSRVNIIACAVALWSSIVTLSAAVTTFWQFALARVGVGIGEAGFSAVAQSLITDLHTARERTRSLSLFMLALPLGGVVSSLMAGWVNEFFGWRAAFLAAGLPGLLLAGLMKWTVEEPVRQADVSPPADERSQRPLRLLLRALWRNQAMRHLAVATALANTVTSCMLVWVPTFLIRSHGMSTGELGSWLGFIGGIGGTLGVWLGGYMTSRLGAHRPRRQLELLALAAACVTPTALAVLWCPAREPALLLLLPTYVLMFFFYGPTFSLVQGLCGPQTRATVAAVFVLIQLVAGGALGVQLVGLLSDAVTPAIGDNAAALRWSLTLVTVLTLFAAACYRRAGQCIQEEAVEGEL